LDRIYIISEQEGLQRALRVRARHAVCREAETALESRDRGLRLRPAAAVRRPWHIPQLFQQRL
jgi:hypothetical protein